MTPIIKIPFKILIQLREYGKENDNNEVGGLLLGRIEKDEEEIIYQVGKFSAIPNIGHKDIRIDYQLDPTSVYRVLKHTTVFNPSELLDFVGIFHTHPFNKPVPSKTDVEYARYKAFYLIYSPLYDDFGSFYSYGSDEHAIDMMGQKNFERGRIILSN